METAQVVTQQFNNIALREKVKELQLRHKRDLELIRNVAAEQVVDKTPGILNAYYFNKLLLWDLIYGLNSSTLSLGIVYVHPRTLFMCCLVYDGYLETRNQWPRQMQLIIMQ